LDGHIDFYTHELVIQSQQDDACQRLQEIHGYGPITASAFYSVIGNREAYSCSRDVSASVGGSVFGDALRIFTFEEKGCSNSSVDSVVAENLALPLI
jgi:hypothetical protein